MRARKSGCVLHNRAVSVCGQAERRKKSTKRKEQCQCTEVSAYVVYIPSTFKTENTYTPARLGALFKSSQSSPFLSHPRLYHSYHPGFEALSFFASDCIRNPSRCFVKKSAVLFFVSTRLTDRRLSLIHCCIDKHRISMCLSPPGPLRCRMCLAESESLKRCSEVP